MTPDLHPEDLIDRRRIGSLTDSERARLEAHLSACPACAFEIRAADDLAVDARPAPGDARLLDRAYDTALRPAAHGWVLGRGRAVAAAAVLVLLTGSLAGAAYWAGTRSAPAPARPSARSAAPEARPRTTSPARIDPPASSPAVPAPEALAAPVRRAPAASARPTTVTPSPSAADLYAAANAARRGGDASAAADLYRELLASHPASREATASRVALGRLLLDRLGDPAAALPLFDAYLARGGTLAEEARLGRALALGRLGRTGEELAAWRDLLERHPQSVHADRARSRLGTATP